MSFIQVDQKFVVETDTTANNTGEDIMGGNRWEYCSSLK